MYTDISELKDKLEAAYEALDDFINTSGLTYDFDNDDYIFKNVVKNNWDREHKASIENAHADLAYILGKTI